MFTILSTNKGCNCAGGMFINNNLSVVFRVLNGDKKTDAGTENITAQDVRLARDHSSKGCHYLEVARLSARFPGFCEVFYNNNENNNHHHHHRHRNNNNNK